MENGLTKSKVLKRGWLRKQGGLVRNWQDRWFVLRESKLQYYAKDDELKQFGCVDLDGGKVVETPYNRDEPNRWLFEVIPAKAGGKLNSHETYPLWASSEAERTDWMSAIRRAIYGHRGGGVFGASLQDVMRYEQVHHNCQVPHVVAQCVDIIRDHGMTVEGIFRLSGSKAQIKEYRRLYDEGERPDLKDACVDVHTAASLLKLYFRELPEPVIPFEYFESFLSLATSFRYNSNHETTLLALKELLKQIPENNFMLLEYLSKFLSEISQHQTVNKMTEMNIALVFGTNILRGEDNSPEFEMATQNLTTHVVLALVKWHDILFSTSLDGNSATLQVNADDFNRLVSLSEEVYVEDMQSVPTATGDSTIVDDLISISESDGRKETGDEVFQQSIKPTPPPIPPRSSDKANPHSPLARTNSEQQTNPTHPQPQPRRANTEIVKTRVATAKKQERPKAVLDVESSHRDSSFVKVERAASNFHSFIDSPLDSRVSLNIGDLPDNVPDLQALVLSLKLEIKELRKKADLQLQKHKKECECMAKLVSNEREAKDDALTRVVQLTQTLIEYQSQFGPLTPMST